MAQNIETSTEVKEKVYCVGCKRNFKFVTEQFEHECNKPSDLYNCYVCKKSFDNRMNFINHIFKHTGKYICGICTEGFEEIIAFEKHMNDHQVLFTYVCKVCHRSFLKIHSSRYFRKYQVCETCHCGWSTNFGYFKRNRREKRYACGHCEEIFIGNYAVALHLWSHKDIRPYVCGFCTFMESDYYVFLSHVVQHRC